MNVRIWKADASAQLGVVLPRERAKQAYGKALVERYKHLPDVKRVVRHRHLPAAIYKTAKARHAVQDADKRKLSRRVAHSAPGSVALKPERKKKIVGEVE
jgi:WD repeat and SOF domain-containing protein 1